VLERLLPGCQVQRVEVLRSSDRASVERVTLAPRQGRTDRVIVKHFLASAGFAMEAAALAVLPAGLPVPTLIAEDRPGQIVVMTDVGDGPSVADALLGTDPRMAQDALGAWAEALAKVHRSTNGLRASFVAAVAERGPGGSVIVDPMPEWLAGVPNALRGSGAGLEVPTEVDDELEALGAGLGGESWAALSPGDTCPDNNVLTGPRLALVDFEEAAFRHVAWDLACVRVPWPSCWCAWGIPEPVASAALGRYFTAMEGTAIGADRATLDRTVHRATLAWALISASWFLPSGLLRNDTMGPPELAAPPRRATVLERFRLVADAAESLGYLALGDAGRSWHRAVERIWGPQSFLTAPALR
jgi:hypothetical protein